MTAYVFHRVTEHLLAGRLNILGGAQLGATLVRGNNTFMSWFLTTNPTSFTQRNADYLSDYSPSIPWDEVLVTPTCTLTDGVMKVTIPSIDFTSPYGNDTAYGVLLYKKESTPATSPLLMIDMFDAVALSPTLTFTYQPSSNGVLKITAI